MKKVRWISGLAACVFLMLGLSACGSVSDSGKENDVQTISEHTELGEDLIQELPDKDNAEADITQEDANAGAVEDQSDTGSDKGTLVVVFSATGTTKGIAEKIVSVTDADLYEIIPASEYTQDDLNYGDSESRASREQNDPDARPEISSDMIDLSAYDRIFIGYPIWFGQEPRIMDTFVESYDFEGITMIPFCTSGSSGIGQSGKHLEENADSGNWLEGHRFAGSASEDEIQSWIEGL